MKSFFFILLVSSQALSVAQSSFSAKEAVQAPAIDGIGNESCWAQASWRPISNLWLGTAPSASDFQGRFKLSWKGTKIYILAEITDDVLYDGHKDPLVQHYDDDCLEIFIDENHSKGNHECTYNAFAYHVAINGDVVDMDTDCKPNLYNNDIQSKIVSTGTFHTWELAMEIYDNTYVLGGTNKAVPLTVNKVCGFSIAYCDDDGSNTRESFIGSEIMPAGHTNDNYKTADYFGILTLAGPPTGLQTESLAPGFNIYTDEAQQIHFKLTEVIKPYKLSIFNSMGLMVFSGKIDGYEYISKSLLPGLYLVILETENRIEHIKILVY
jgi:hypothetical protein